MTAPSLVTAPKRPTPALLDRLRTETSALHEQLEAILQLGAGPITAPRYVRFLRVMQAVTPQVESRIAAVPGWLELMPYARQRRRAARIERDLAVVSGASLGAPELCCQLPEIEQPSQAFGASYVLEGSSLGGVVIARTLGPALGLSAEHGLSFVCAYGPQLREYWRAFTQAIEHWAQGATVSEQDLTVTTAQATFRAFLDQATATHVQ